MVSELPAQMRAVLFVVILFLCNFVHGEGPTAEEILSGEAPTGDYVKSTRCIVASRIEDTEVLSDRFIVFHLVRNELWLASLPSRCTGLTPKSDVLFERNNDRICEWDFVRTISPAGIEQVDLGPRCRLPAFETVTPEQVALLKREIAAARRGARTTPRQ